MFQWNSVAQMDRIRQVVLQIVLFVLGDSNVIRQEVLLLNVLTDIIQQREIWIVILVRKVLHVHSKNLKIFVPVP